MIRIRRIGFNHGEKMEEGAEKIFFTTEGTERIQRGTEKRIF